MYHNISYFSLRDNISQLKINNSKDERFLMVLEFLFVILFKIIHCLQRPLVSELAYPDIVRLSWTVAFNFSF